MDVAAALQHGEDLHVLYLWFLPDRLLLPPTYLRAHYDRVADVNRMTRLVGRPDGRLPIDQDVRISRLVTDRPGSYSYAPATPANGTYTFVIGGDVDVDGERLAAGDSIGSWDRDRSTITTGEGSSDVLVVETAMKG